MLLTRVDCFALQMNKNSFWANQSVSYTGTRRSRVRTPKSRMSSTSRVITMLQQQQSSLTEQQQVLQQLLNKQNDHSSELEELKKKLLTFEQTLADTSNSLLLAPKGSPKERIKVARSFLVWFMIKIFDVTLIFLITENCK